MYDYPQYFLDVPDKVRAWPAYLKMLLLEELSGTRMMLSTVLIDFHFN